MSYDDSHYITMVNLHILQLHSFVKPSLCIYDMKKIKPLSKLLFTGDLRFPGNHFVADGSLYSHLIQLSK